MVLRGGRPLELKERDNLEKYLIILVLVNVNLSYLSGCLNDSVLDLTLSLLTAIILMSPDVARRLGFLD